MLIVAAMSTARCTRVLGVMTGLRHLSMMMPAMSCPAARGRSGQLRVLRIAWFGRFRGGRAMMVVMVFHVALTCGEKGYSMATWATVSNVNDQKQHD